MTQELKLHLHVRAVMACGGLDAMGVWVTPKRSPTFLFPVRALSNVFRAKFLEALRQAQDSGELECDPCNTPLARRARAQALGRKDWVVYAKTPLAGPETVLDYLSRYTHRVAVSPALKTSVAGSISWSQRAHRGHGRSGRALEGEG